MNVVVVGGGKMGLPLACQLAENGAQVTVCDINPRQVAGINAGEAHFHEPGLAEYLTRNVARGRLRATTDTSLASSQAEVIIIIVPALLTSGRTIDYGNLKEASAAVARGLRTGALVSYETTVPVGGVRNELVPVLEQSGLRAGQDFYVCFSPERVKSLKVFDHLCKTPKVVGGFDDESAVRAEAFYSHYLGTKIFNVGSLEAAEFVKLAGMVYRDVNIALVNELAAFCEATGIDFSRVVGACNTDGEAFLLNPGIGVGGHCTPVYPYFMTHAAEHFGVPQRLAEYARAINEEQPARHIRRLALALGTLAGKAIHILGLGFRPDVKEHSYSPAFALRDELARHGAVVTIEDPWYGDEELRAFGFAPARIGHSCMDAVVLNTAHSKFLQPDFRQWRSAGVRVILDGRNVWRREAAEAAGLSYVGVGVPGGERVRAVDIPITRPVLGGAEARAADAAIRSGWVGQRTKVAKFERMVADYCGTAHAVAVASGTAALHLALLALDIQPGDEVICPSLSFIATANAIRHAGAVPVFAEVDPLTYNLDADAVEAAITPRTRAILVVHQIGLPADLERFHAIGAKYGVKVFEDAACAMGSRYKGRTIGGHSEMACFSFHPRKVICTGEGGMITTNKAVYAERLRLLRQHGMSLRDTECHAARSIVFEEYLCLGYNYRLTDIQAAVGVEQMKKLDWILSRRRELAARYTQALAKHPWLMAPHVPDYAEPNYQSYAVRLLPQAPVSRNEFMQRLLDGGIATRRGIMLSHLEAPYAADWAEGEFPRSEEASENSVLLPLYPQMSDGEQDRVLWALSASRFGAASGALDHAVSRKAI